MPYPVIASAVIQHGRLKVRNRLTLDEQVAGLRHGDEVELRIERKHATRSLNQHAWYWGCLVQLVSEHTGYSPDEIHEIYKAKFLPKRLAVLNGNGDIRGEFVIGGTTTRLNKLEFGEFCEAIRRWAAEELDVVIPDPEQ